LYKRFSKFINIIVIYISEAHAKDEWPISFTNRTNQHKNIEERIKAAKEVDNLNLPLYCDSFDQSSFENVFSAWPERAFIVENNIIKYISYHTVDGYDDWHSNVENYVNSKIEN
jgi:hypothetical protein